MFRDGDALNPNAGIIEEFLRAATTRDAGGVHLVTLEDFARKQVSLMGKVLFFPIEQPRWLVYAVRIPSLSLSVCALAEPTKERLLEFKLILATLLVLCRTVAGTKRGLSGASDEPLHKQLMG